MSQPDPRPDSGRERNAPPSRFLLASVSLLTAAAVLTAPVAAQGPQAAIDEALARIEAGQIDAAIVGLEAHRGSGEAPLLAMLGGLYVEAGRNAEALEILEPLAAAGTDPAVLYNAGRAAKALGSIEKAIDHLRRSVQLAPQTPAVRELGLTLGAVGAYGEAYPHLRLWSSQFPDDSEVRLAAALCAVQLERGPDAESLLSDLPQEDPKIRLLWGRTLLLKGDPWGALGYLRPLLAEPPPYMEADIRASAARAQLMVGESGEAIGLLEGRTGDDPVLALQLAQAYYQNGRVEDALSTLERFAEAVLGAEDPSTVGAVGANVALEYGRLLYTSGDHDSALRYLELAAQLTPAKAQVWQTMAQALGALGRRDDARVAIERFEVLTAGQDESSGLEEQDAQDPTGRQIRQAMALAAQGRGAEAIRILRQESQLAPTDVRPPLLASRLLLASGEIEEANRAADRAIELAPDMADSRYQKGAVLMSLDELTEAEQLLRSALEVQPDHTGALSDLAILLMNDGRNDEARGLLERVLQIRPDDPTARRSLEQING